MQSGASATTSVATKTYEDEDGNDVDDVVSVGDDSNAVR